MRELYFGGLISLLMFIWLTAEKVLGLQDEYIQWHPYVTNIAILIPLIGYWLALKNFSLTPKVRITFLYLFRSGLIITLIIAFLSLPSIYIFYEYINPDWTSTMVIESQKRALENGEDINKAMQSAEAYFSMKSYMMQSFFGNLILGIVLSTLFSYKLSRPKKRKNSFN